MEEKLQAQEERTQHDVDNVDTTENLQPDDTKVVPVESATPLETGYFDTPRLEITDYFTEEAVSFKPLEPQVAAESALITSILSGEVGSPEMIANVNRNLEYLGYDETYNMVLESEYQAHRDATYNTIFEDSILSPILADNKPSRALELMKDIRTEAEMLTATNKRAYLIASTVDSLSPQQKKAYADFGSIMSEVLYARAVDDMLSVATEEASDRASIGEWIAGLLNPLYPVTSRSDQKKVTDYLVEKLGKDANIGEVVSKALSTGLFEDFLMDPNLSTEEVYNRLGELKEILEQANERDDINPVYTMEILDLARTRINDERLTGAVLLDALDATVVYGYLRTVAKFAKLKLFGRAGARAGVLKPEDVKNIQLEIREIIDASNPQYRPQKPRLKVNAGGKVVIPSVRPGSGSLADAMANANPEQFRIVLSNTLKKNPDDVLALGLTPEEMALRFTPRRDAELGFHPSAMTGMNTNKQAFNYYDDAIPSDIKEKFNRELADHNTINLLEPREIQAGVDDAIRSIAENSRGTLNPSGFDILREEDGTLIVRSLFQKNVDEGYGSLEEARNAAQFLYGDEYNIVAKRSGVPDVLRNVDELDGVEGVEFFVEGTHRITPTPNWGKAYNEGMTLKMPFSDYAVSWSRRIKKDLFDQLSAFTDKGNRLATLQRKMLEPVLRLRGKAEADQWTRLLLHGDANEMVFTKQAAREFLGGKMSDRVWNAYTGTRDFVESAARVRDKAVYATLHGAGYRSAYGSNGILKDLSGMVHIKPLGNKPERLPSRPDKPDINLNSVWGSRIYDTTKGEFVDLTDELLESLYDEGSSLALARTSRPASFVENLETDFIILPRDQIKPLIANPMGKRVGHLDRNYAGEAGLMETLINKTFGKPVYKGGTGYRVEQRITRNINGQEVPDVRVVGLYANRAQAEAARAKLTQQLEAKLISEGKSPEEVAEMVTPYSVNASRELSFELGLDNSGSIVNLPAHARKRGEQVQGLGPDGLAEVASIEDTLTSMAGNIRRNLLTDIIEVEKRRWKATYGDFFDGLEGFPTEWGTIKAKAISGVHSEVLTEAQRHFERIINMQQAMSGKLMARWIEDMNQWVEGLKNADSAMSRATGKVFQSMLDSNFLGASKELTATFFIASRVLYQTMANSAQTAFLFVQNPARFTTQTLPRTTAILMGLAARKMGADDKAMSVIAKVFGGVSGDFNMTGKQFSKYLDGMIESGLLSTSLADDVFSVITESARIEAGRHNVLSGTFWKRMVPGMGGFQRVGKLGMVPQRIATDFSKIAAYAHSTNRAIAKYGINALDKRQVRTEILGDTQRLTWNQNRADQFAYQQNFLSIQLQFVQHVHRMWMDLIADPTVRALTFNKLKLSKDGTNLYAGSWAQSVWTLAGIGSLFGLETFLPAELEGQAIKGLREMGAPEDAIDYFMNGLIGGSMKHMFGEEFDIEDRISPIGAMQTTLEMMFTHDGGLALGGPAAAVWDTAKTLYQIGSLYHKNEKMSADVALELMGDVASKAFAGWRDAEKAFIAYNWQQYRDNSGRPIAEVGDMSWLPILFSVTPEKVSDYYAALDDHYDTEDFTLKVVKAVNSLIISDLAKIPEDQLTGNMLVEHWQKGLNMIDMSFSTNPRQRDEAIRMFGNLMKEPEQSFLLQHAEKIIQVMSADRAIVHLERLKEKYPESIEVLDHMITTLKEEQ